MLVHVFRELVSDYTDMYLSLLFNDEKFPDIC